jgi:hypothetical protein
MSFHPTSIRIHFTPVAATPSSLEPTSESDNPSSVPASESPNCSPSVSSTTGVGSGVGIGTGITGVGVGLGTGIGVIIGAGTGVGVGLEVGTIGVETIGGFFTPEEPEEVVVAFWGIALGVMVSEVVVEVFSEDVAKPTGVVVAEPGLFSTDSKN